MGYGQGVRVGAVRVVGGMASFRGGVARRAELETEVSILAERTLDHMHASMPAAARAQCSMASTMLAPLRRLARPSLPRVALAQCACRRATRTEQTRCFASSPATFSGHSYAPSPTHAHALTRRLADWLTAAQQMGHHQARQGQK